MLNFNKQFKNDRLVDMHFSISQDLLKLSERLLIYWWLLQITYSSTTILVEIVGGCVIEISLEEIGEMFRVPKQAWDYTEFAEPV